MFSADVVYTADFTPQQIGYLALCFTISGIICGFVSSFAIMQSFCQKQEPRLDWLIRVFIGIGYLSLIGLLLLSLFQVQSFLMVHLS